MYGTMKKKPWYYGHNYGTILRTMELRKKYGRLLKTKKLWFIMEKPMVINQNYFLFYYGKNYDTLPKTMELWLTMENNYGTMEKKTMVL